MLGVLVAVVAVFALRQSDKPTDTAGTGAAPLTSGVSSPGPASSSTPVRSSTPATRSRTSPTRRASTNRSASTTRPPSTPDPSASAAARAVPVIVLNNTTTSGLASQAAARFKAGGWRVTSYGNLTNDIVSTCAYYDPSVAGAHAAALALQQQYPTIKRVTPKFAELPAGPVVVVLTPDYSP